MMAKTETVGAGVTMILVPEVKCRSKIPQVIGPPSQGAALGMANHPPIPLLHGSIGKLVGSWRSPSPPVPPIGGEISHQGSIGIEGERVVCR